MDTPGIKKRMKDMHITAAMMIKELGMDSSTYYRKMQRGGGEFSALDLSVFKRVLKMNEQDAVKLLLS